MDHAHVSAVRRRCTSHSLVGPKCLYPSLANWNDSNDIRAVFSVLHTSQTALLSHKLKDKTFERG